MRYKTKFSDKKKVIKKKYRHPYILSTIHFTYEKHAQSNEGIWL